MENFESVNQKALICDFGLSRFVNLNGKYQFVASLKEPELNGLTLRYASPEVKCEYERLQESF